MQSLMGNPYEDEMLKRLRAPSIGIRPYQSQLKPGESYGQFYGGNSNNGITPLPSPPGMGGPAPLPPNFTRPFPGPGPIYGGNPITPLPDPRGNPDPIQPMLPGNEYQGNIPRIATTDIVEYYNSITGETKTGPSYGSGLREEDGWGRVNDNRSGIGSVSKDLQNLPIARFLPPSNSTQPPINTMPTLPVPDYGPLLPGGPKDKPDYRLARPNPGMGRPGLPDRGNIQAVPFQGQGYNRRTSSSPSISPSFIGGAPKTKRTFGN